MTDVDVAARETCHRFLTTQELRTICRLRGFRAPKGGKAELADFVAPRLLEPTGVSEALRSLSEPWLLALHRIALSKTPPTLRDLLPIVAPEHSGYDIDYRGVFREIGKGLLSCGVVLVEECDTFASRGTSRFEHLAYLLPEVHRPSLPAFPVATVAPEGGLESRNVVGFCREVLREAAATMASRSAKSRPTGLLPRLAAAVSLADGRLRIGDAAVTDLAGLLRCVQSAWVGTKKGLGERSAAAHILAHLPPRAGVTVPDLQEALRGMGFALSRRALVGLCEDGHRAGLLARGDAEPCYRAISAADAVRSDGPLAFCAHDRGLEVDLLRTGVEPLLALAALSRAEFDRGRLYLLPDTVRLGRAAPRLASIPVLAEIRSVCPAFDRALRLVEKRQGQILLHDGLLLLRIEDVGFRALLSQELGSKLKSLGGALLAAPRSLRPQVEKLARREGFAPRVVS